LFAVTPTPLIADINPINPHSVVDAVTTLFVISLTLEISKDLSDQ